MMRRAALAAGAAVAVLGLVLARNGVPVFEVLGGLAFGWVSYAARVVPRVTISWGGVLTGVLCLALFAAGLHRALRWLDREIQGAGDETATPRRPWPVRWTASLVVLIVLMFAAGTAATGIVHQAGWLIASRESLVEERVRSRDDWGSSAEHLGEIGMASSALETARGSLPGGGVRQSWMTGLLPYTRFALGGELRRDLPWDDPRNSAYFKGVVPIYLNPEVRVLRSPEGYALGHYAGNVHVLGPGRVRSLVATGEASNTILAGEVAEGFKPWGDPSNLRDPGLGVNAVPGGFGGPSGSGAHLLFADGSVRFFRDTTAPEVLRRLSLPESPAR